MIYFILLSCKTLVHIVMPDIITSTRNPRIKSLISLQKPKERKARGLFIVEGYRELIQAVHAGYEVMEMYYCPEIAGNKLSSFPLCNFSEVFEIDTKVYEQLAYRDSTEGFVAVAKMKVHEVQDIILPAKPLILVLETIEKPGNLGAVMRTADAANIDAVFLCDNKTDLYNPNVVRSSLGCIFTRQIALMDSGSTITWLKEKKIQIIVSSLQAGKYYYNACYTSPTAIIMGSESNGISDQWIAAADSIVKIPMYGRVDSMNVSVSAGIIMYEAIRQRNFKQVS